MLPTEVIELITRKIHILEAPISTSAGFDDYALEHCAEYVIALTRGGVVHDTPIALENAGKCGMKMTDCAGVERIYRKSPLCHIHGCAHDW